jgi:pimeloyl-ACP methyl ester carboxylesterase
MRGETTSADGTTIRWLAVGQGPPLVLVPGGLGDEHAFDPLVERLAARVCCVTMGRRGKGFSDDSPDYSYDREYEDVTAVVDAVGPPRLLFAHSSGAICALGAALKSPMDKLVIVEPPLPLEEPGIAAEHQAAVTAALNRGEEEAPLSSPYAMACVSKTKRSVDCEVAVTGPPCSTAAWHGCESWMRSTGSRGTSNGIARSRHQPFLSTGRRRSSGVARLSKRSARRCPKRT